MNTNYDIVENLISLLVKRAGFDIKSNYSEEELTKVKNSIKELQLERESSNNKKVLSKMIEDLKVRQANWENNAEIVGKSLLTAYKENKPYQTVRMRVELLSNLANKNNSYESLSYLYDKLSSLESEYNNLKEKINNNSYESHEEKEMDKRYKSYLEEKISSIDLELDGINKTLDELRESEKNDVNIVNKVKEYINKLENDLEKINSVLDNTLTSFTTYESFEKIENTNNKTIEKIDKFNELLNKTEGVLNEVRESRKKNNDRKSYLERERETYSNKLNKVSVKLEENDYVNNIEKMEDINKSELLRLEIDSLNNIKDVLYIDINKVKEELIKEWERHTGNNDTSKIENSVKFEEPKEIKEEIKKEEKPVKKDIIEKIKDFKINSKPEVKEEKNKIELDW